MEHILFNNSDVLIYYFSVLRHVCELQFLPLTSSHQILEEGWERIKFLGRNLKRVIFDSPIPQTFAYLICTLSSNLELSIYLF